MKSLLLENKNQGDFYVQKLEHKVAELFRKDCALFVPDKKIADLLAIMAGVKERNNLILVDESSNLYRNGSLAFGGVHPILFKNSDESSFLKNIKVQVKLHQDINLVSFENEFTLSSINIIKRLKSQMKIDKIGVHLSGNNLFEMSHYFKEPLFSLTKNVDLVSFSLTDLRYPISGAIIVGDNQNISRAKNISERIYNRDNYGLFCELSLLALRDWEKECASAETNIQDFFKKLQNMQSQERVYIAATHNMISVALKNVIAQKMQQYLRDSFILTELDESINSLKFYIHHDYDQEKAHKVIEEIENGIHVCS